MDDSEGFSEIYSSLTNFSASSAVMITGFPLPSVVTTDCPNFFFSSSIFLNDSLSALSVSYTHLTLPTIHSSCIYRWAPGQ